MESLRILRIVTLTYIIKVTNLKCENLENAESYRQVLPYDFI